MTSVQSMFNVSLQLHRTLMRLRARWCCIPLTLLILLVAAPACQRRLQQPDLLAAPYQQPELWAVAPFANESGVSIVDTYRVADMFTQQVQQINGVEAVPVNRVLSVMRLLGLNAIESELDAVVLMNTLEVDALVIGSITAWDPYRPPTLAAAVELYRSDASQRGQIDPIQISRHPSGDPLPGQMSDGPAAVAAGVFDARNHQTLYWLEQYAESRTLPDSAYGNDIYLVSMDLYMQFVSYRLLHDLLQQERIRLHPIATADEEMNTR